jgi:hypothetical protein
VLDVFGYYLVKLCSWDGGPRASDSETITRKEPVRLSAWFPSFREAAGRQMLEVHMSHAARILRAKANLARIDTLRRQISSATEQVGHVHLAFADAGRSLL